MLTDPNSPFLSVVGLGALKSEHPPQRARWVSLTFGVTGLLFTPLCLLLAVLLGYDAYSQHGLARVGDAVVLPLLGAAAAFVIGVATAWEAWRIWPVSARLYEEGFALNTRRGLQVVRWDQVEATWQRVTRRYTNGIYTGTTHSYTVRTKDQSNIMLDDKLTNVEQLGRAVQQGVSTALFPSYVQALQAGQRLSFGPLALDQTKLYAGNKELAWNEIQAIKINRGRVSVKKEKGWLDWAQAAVPQIPNFFIFLDIVSRLTKVE
jgi:hypothetical protein